MHGNILSNFISKHLPIGMWTMRPILKYSHILVLLTYIILRFWLIYTDEKEHCEYYFKCESAFYGGFQVSVLLIFLKTSMSIPNINHYSGLWYKQVQDYLPPMQLINHASFFFMQNWWIIWVKFVYTNYAQSRYSNKTITPIVH